MILNILSAGCRLVSVQAQLAHEANHAARGKKVPEMMNG
jgi:hypothetical protein